MNNPVLWLELRVRIRERKLWIVTCLYLLCLLVISGIALSAAANEGGSRDPAETGLTIYCYGIFALLGLLVILGPLASAGSISQEREQRTLPALLNTPMSPTAIALGKLLAAWIFVVWLALLSLPFLALAVVWGAVELGRMLEGLALTIAAGLVCAAIAVGLSGYFRRSLTSYLTTGAVLFFWLIVWPIFGVLAAGLFGANGDPKNYPALFYTFFYHHPVAPVVVLLMSQLSREATPPVIPFALAVWSILALLFFLLARHGLGRSAARKS